MGTRLSTPVDVFSKKYAAASRTCDQAAKLLLLNYLRDPEDYRGPTRKSSIFGQDAKTQSNLIVVEVFSAKLCLKSPKLFLDRVSTGGGWDRVSVKHADFADDF